MSVYEWFAVSSLVLAHLGVIVAIVSSGRLAREALRQQADMQRMLAVREAAREPAGQPIASLLATMGLSDQRAPASGLTRTPIVQESGPRYDAQGYDMDQNLQP